MFLLQGPSVQEAAWPLKLGPIGSPETSVQTTLRRIKTQKKDTFIFVINNNLHFRNATFDAASSHTPQVEWRCVKHVTSKIFLGKLAKLLYTLDVCVKYSGWMLPILGIVKDSSEFPDEKCNVTSQEVTVTSTMFSINDEESCWLLTLWIQWCGKVSLIRTRINQVLKAQTNLDFLLRSNTEILHTQETDSKLANSVSICLFYYWICTF
jgi:hypothetical protein